MRQLDAVSVVQPWASALFVMRPKDPSTDAPSIPLKPHETRTWRMPARFVAVEVAIHASRRETDEERNFWTDDVLDSPYRQVYGEAFATIGIQSWLDLPRGCLIGTVVFGASRATEGHFNTEEIAREWGNYGVGRFAWPVIKRKLFKHPIPCRGLPGFFPVQIPVAHD
jgi:hypothetical protein